MTYKIILILSFLAMAKVCSYAEKLRAVVSGWFCKAYPVD